MTDFDCGFRDFGIANGDFLWYRRRSWFVCGSYIKTAQG